MKICMIGPSYPFRGGISHYTTLLCRHLKKKHQVIFYAFKRQYPGWLFPGETDKDSSNKSIKEKGTENLLDSLNPFTWLIVFLRIRKDRPDLVIFPWWVSFWAPQFWTIATLIKLFTPAKLLFICHNVVEHESKKVDKICTRWVLSKGNYFVVHSGEDFRNLKQILPDANIKQGFHPTYEVFQSGMITKEEAKKKLDLTGKVILFFGFVRPYKGLQYLIAALPMIIQELEVTLLVVGEFWEGEEIYRSQIKDLGLEPHVRLVVQYVPNEQVGVYFSASDVVILPYVSATGSGIVQVAFGCNKPVISTNVGSLPEVIEHKKTGFIVNPKAPKEIADTVVSFYQDEWEDELVKNVMAEKDRFSWGKMVELIESFQ